MDLKKYEAAAWNAKCKMYDLLLDEQAVDRMLHETDGIDTLQDILEMYYDDVESDMQADEAKGSVNYAEWAKKMMDKAHAEYDPAMKAKYIEYSQWFTQMSEDETRHKEKLKIMENYTK